LKISNYYISTVPAKENLLLCKPTLLSKHRRTKT